LNGEITSGRYYYMQLMRTFGKKNIYDADCIVSETNFCIDSNSSHTLALYDISKRGGPISDKMDKEVHFNFVSPYSFLDDQWAKMYLNLNRDKIFRSRGNGQQEDESFGKPLGDVCCKTIYCINFDNTPYSNGLYCNNTIETNCNSPITLTIERTNNGYQHKDTWVKNPNIYFYVTAFFDIYSVYQMRSDGRLQLTNSRNLRPNVTTYTVDDLNH
jgi:hypothetical protein